MVLDFSDEGSELRVGVLYAAPSDDALFHVWRKAVFERTASDAYDSDPFGQEAGLVEVIERGQELALGEIAGSSEDDDDAGIGRALGLRSCGDRGDGCVSY